MRPIALDGGVAFPLAGLGYSIGIQFLLRFQAFNPARAPLADREMVSDCGMVAPAELNLTGSLPL